MADKAPDPATSPRRRVPLRLQLEAAGTAVSGAVPLGFQPAADQACGDRDALFCYELFLGRDPENSHVIASARSASVKVYLRGVLGSPEFQGAVVGPMQRGQALPHERTSLGPSAEQAEWVTNLLRMPPETAAKLRAAPSWRAFFTALAGVPGFSLAPPQAAEEAAPAIAAADAEPDFMLITIDQPKPGEKLHPGALVSGSGWAIAGADIVEIGIWLDDTLLDQARYGLPRPDVARNFPHYRHVDHCGFAFSAQVPEDAKLTRQSQLVVAVRTAGGLITRKGVRIEPPAAASITQPAWPIRLFVEDVRLDATSLRLRGWAASRVPLAAIGVYLADDKLGEADLGLARPDIAATHGEYPNAANSGFVFEADLRGAPAGPQALRVQVTDQQGAQRQAIVPVTIPAAIAYAEKPAPAPAPSVQAQADNLRVSCDGAWLAADGTLRIEGWVISETGAADISVFHADKLIGTAAHGGPRPDVARVYPKLPHAATSGFALRAKPQPRLAAGAPLRLEVNAGAAGTRSLEVALEAEPAPPPNQAEPMAAGADGMRLEIDQPPLHGDTAPTPVRGALTIEGWAVAVPGIAGITVLCDGKRLGQAYVGKRREDIARAFPQCTDALRAGYALVLPPGTLPDGQHTIEVVAKARDGATTQRHFGVRIEPADAPIAGSTPRLRVPRMEVAVGETLINAAGPAAPFHILVQELPAREARAGALATTLAGLERQAFGAFTATILSPGAAQARAAEALLHTDFARLAGRVTVVAASPKARRLALPRPPALAWMMTLRAGDELGADALLELAAARATWPDAGFVYGDDIRFDPAAGRDAAFFKPDHSPELLLSLDYIGRPFCVSPAAMQQAGVSHEELAALSPYAASLRLCRSGCVVRHVSKVLARIAPDVPGAQRDAVRAELKRSGVAAEVKAGPLPGVWRVRRDITAPGLVSVIIPTAGARHLIRACIASLRATTARGALEIIALDNIPAREKALKTWLRRNADQVLAMPPPFNWSRFNNAGAAVAKGKYLLFLNDDIEAKSPGWLDALLEHAQRPEVGLVGARLLYPDGKVQHGGQYLAETHARHAFRFSSEAEHGPFGLARAAREMSAVTGACQLIRREVFERLGRFDEAHDVVNNDLDFCLRAQREGYAVIYTPHAELVHHELASRADLEDSYDIERFATAWRSTLMRGDPYHSPRLMADADHWAPDPEPVLPVFAGPRGPRREEVRRILAVKLDHIGDYLTAVPALRSLKERFPQARVTLLAPPATAALARHEKSLDAVQEFAFFHARSGEGARGVSEGELAALGARLANEKFDIAIDLRMQPETREVLRHSGARLLAGYDQSGRYPWLDVALEWEGDLRLLQKHDHIAGRLLALVAALDVACAPLPPGAIAAPGDPAAVKALAALPRAFLARPLACVHPGVGNPVRQWPPAAFAALIDLLADELGMSVVLIGGGDEQVVAEDVLARVAARHAVASLVGAVKLAELQDVMRACALFVGNNSGPQHIAAAAGVPAIGIHSGVVDAGEWAPLGPGAMALQRHVICGPCYLEFASDCPRGMACLTGIRPRHVLEACRALLAMRRRAALPDARGARRKRTA